MGGEKKRKFAKRGTAEGNALIGISREKGGNIEGSGRNKLPACKHAELAMLAMRGRAFIERRLSGGQFEVMRGTFDCADRHQDARDFGLAWASSGQNACSAMASTARKAARRLRRKSIAGILAQRAKKPESTGKVTPVM